MSEASHPTPETVVAPSENACRKCGAEPVPPESGWVLIQNDPAGLRYLAVHPSGFFEWSTDNLRALRLSRRADAEALVAIIYDAEEVQHHGWG